MHPQLLLSGKQEGLERGSISSSVLSRAQLLAAPWTIAQAPLSMEFSRQESWSEMPLPTPGDLPNLGSLVSPAPAEFFTTSANWEAPQLFKMYHFSILEFTSVQFSWSVVSNSL